MKTPTGDTEMDDQEKNLEKIVKKNVQLYNSPYYGAFTRVQSGDYQKVYLLYSDDFREYLRSMYYKKYDQYPRTRLLQEFIHSLEHQAKDGSHEKTLFVRIASTKKAIYLDLCDEEWRAVKITADGWKVVRKPQVMFLRTEGCLPLPKPVEAKNPKQVFIQLINFFNTTPKERALIIGWLIGAFNGSGPYPILAIQGESGSAKSTLSRMLKGLIDPSHASARALPKKEHDLMVAAMNSWVLSFDNISVIERDMSDALCRLSTGGGFSKKKSKSRTDELLFDAVRPILLNSIGNITLREDLASRTLSVEMIPLDNESTKPESQIFDKFNEQKPAFLGALLTAVSTALRNKNKIHLDEYPRMADFFHFVAAAEEAVYSTKGTLLTAITDNNKIIGRETIESDLFASALEKFIQSQTNIWKGTASELLKQIQMSIPTNELESIAMDKSWPRAANALSARLRELAPMFRQAGYEIEQDRRTARRRQWILDRNDRESKDPRTRKSWNKNDR
jgi:energy-coupling factor transporter ATP-binding protein EcfA2